MSAKILTMPSAPAINPHERLNRISKALKLANILDEYGISSETAIAFTPQQWELAADGAGVRPPSQLTQALTVEMIQARERVRAGRRGDEIA